MSEAGKPEGLPGSQVEQTGDGKIIITPEEENNPARLIQNPRARLDLSISDLKSSSIGIHAQDVHRQ